MPIGDGVTCSKNEIADVFPQYVTWERNPRWVRYDRKMQDDPGMGRALMHKNMAQLKSYITTTAANDDGTMAYDVVVYEIVKGVAHKLYDLPAGSIKAESDLWKKKPKDRAVVVDEDAVAAAIASITKGLN